MIRRLPSDLWRASRADMLAAARHNYPKLHILTVRPLTTGLWCATVHSDGTIGPNVYPGMTYPDKE